MSVIKSVLIAVFVLFFNSITVFANDAIQINRNQYFIDVNHKVVITNLDVSWVNSTWTNSKSYVFLNETCSFSKPIDKVEVGTAYEIYIPSYNSVFKLYFTELPIISISTDSAIVDETNVLGNFKMIETNQKYLESYVGIQYRGGWSQSLPKKSMEIEFWTDTTGNNTQDFSLLGMRTDSDWNLQAMYNEPLKISSKTNNELWLKINTLSYKNSEPEAINGIRMEYAQLFINNEYRGIYCLGEKVDRKQLKLKKYSTTIRGELYKGVSWDGASTFSSLPSYSNSSLLWGGFEYKHPNEKTDWSNLYNLVDFVINSPDDTFYQQYYNRFEVDNLVDYFIFLNLLRATDNTGKNLYIAKYDTKNKYFYVPWDLDGTFGTIWDGSKDATTNDILGNGFYNRLMYDCNTNGFREKLKNRWLQLRSTIITRESLISMFKSNYAVLERNGVYEKESLVWPDYRYETSNLDYMSNWIADRLAYLDVKFTENCMLLSTNEFTPKSKLINVYPNPTNDLISIDVESLNQYKVSVYNSLGQIVLDKMCDSSDKTVSLGSFNEGIYFLKIENQEYSEVHRIIVTK